MKIVHIVFNLNGYSGAALQANSLRKHISTPSRILSIESANPAGAFNPPDEGIYIYPNKNPLEYLKMIPPIIKAKIVHMHGYSLPAMLISIMLRKKIILKTTLSNDDDFHALRKKRFGWLRVALVRFIDVNVALSSEIYEINKQYFPAKKIVRIPNGVALKPKQSPPKNAPVFCTVGVISPRKGISNAIRYFNDNYAHLPGAVLYVVGPRPSDTDFNLLEGDMEYYNHCKELAIESPAKIIFTGKLKKNELNLIYDESLSFLFFSEKEGMPNVLLEAMSHNCVPVTGIISGVALEVIDDKVNGFVIQSLGKRIPLENIIELSKKNAPLEKIVRSFDIKTISKTYSCIYENI